MTIYKGAQRRGSRRMTAAQSAVISLLRGHPTGVLSYDEMTAAIGRYDRRTLITAMRCLELRGLVVVERGAGRRPNRYAVK